MARVLSASGLLQAADHHATVRLPIHAIVSSSIQSASKANFAQKKRKNALKLAFAMPLVALALVVTQAKALEMEVWRNIRYRESSRILMPQLNSIFQHSHKKISGVSPVTPW